MGTITHYFQNVGAAIIQVDAGEIRVGDLLHFFGHTTDFRERVDRMELDHQAVPVARAGQTVGVHVAQRVREHDQVIRPPRS